MSGRGARESTLLAEHKNSSPPWAIEHPPNNPKGLPCILLMSYRWQRCRKIWRFTKKLSFLPHGSTAEKFAKFGKNDPLPTWRLRSILPPGSSGRPLSPGHPTLIPELRTFPMHADIPWMANTLGTKQSEVSLKKHHFSMTFWVVLCAATAQGGGQGE